MSKKQDNTLLLYGLGGLALFLVARAAAKKKPVSASYGFSLQRNYLSPVLTDSPEVYRQVSALTLTDAEEQAVTDAHADWAEHVRAVLGEQNKDVPDAEVMQEARMRGNVPIGKSIPAFIADQAMALAYPSVVIPKRDERAASDQASVRAWSRMRELAREAPWVAA